MSMDADAGAKPFLTTTISALPEGRVNIVAPWASVLLCDTVDDDLGAANGAICILNLNAKAPGFLSERDGDVQHQEHSDQQLSHRTSTRADGDTRVHSADHRRRRDV